MQTKRTLILGILLLILIGGLFLTQKQGQKKDRGPAEKLFPIYTMAKVDSLKISEAGRTVVFFRQASRWMLAAAEPYPADTTDLFQVLRSLDSLKQSFPKSTKKETWATFEVDSIKAVQVAAQAGPAVLARFYLGKNGPGFAGSYVRVQGNDNTYLVEGLNKYTFTKETDQWRDKTIIGFDKLKVSEITLNYREGDPEDPNADPKDKKKKPVVRKVYTLQLKKESGDMWAVVSPASLPADKDKVEAYLDKVLDLKSWAWYYSEAPQADYGFGDPEIMFSAKMLDGSVATLTVGKASVSVNSRLYVQSTTHGGKFTMEKYQLKDYKKTAEELKAEPKPEAAAPGEPEKKDSAQPAGAAFPLTGLPQ
jgi:hypothetical protein